MNKSDKKGNRYNPYGRVTSKGGKGKGQGFGKAGTRSADQKLAAQSAASTLIDSLEGDIYYTDGACKNNPGPAGAGVHYVSADGKRVEQLSHCLGKATNNQAELKALTMALIHALVNVEPPEPRLSKGGGEQKAQHNHAFLTWNAQKKNVHFLTDSSYCHGILTKNWVAKKNQAMIAHLRTLVAMLETLVNVKVHWIAGHVDTHGNKEADNLANGAVGYEADAETVIPSKEALPEALFGLFGDTEGHLARKLCVIVLNKIHERSRDTAKTMIEGCDSTKDPWVFLDECVLILRGSLKDEDAKNWMEALYLLTAAAKGKPEKEPQPKTPEA